MFSIRTYRVLIGLVMVCSFIATVAPAIEAASCKVLVVMSYEEINPWCIEIKEGIDLILANVCEVTYFYMDTKKNFKGGQQKSKEAYSLYQKLHPDGVIAADDNAQWMFVLPYLKDQVSTPVMFCAVNAEADKYGYPATNVSGILERNHIRESIALAKQLVPTIKTVGFLAKDSLPGKAILHQVEIESDTYVAEVIDFKLTKTIKETLAVIERFKAQADLLFLAATNGIFDNDGKPLDNKQVTQIVSKAYGKPMIGGNRFHVDFGALCAVVKTGQEQGIVASEMLLKAIQGAAVSEIPITRNYEGKRVVNVTVMEKLGITPRPIILLGTQLVKTKE